MTVKELKEMLNNVPDDFVIGKHKREVIKEGFFSDNVLYSVEEVNVYPNVDLKNKMVMFSIK